MMSRYRRLFFNPASYSLDGSIVVEPAYDVATEISFPAKNAMASGNTRVSNNPEVERIFEADEERFVDRSTRRFLFVESHESVLRWVPESTSGEFVWRAPA